MESQRFTIAVIVFLMLSASVLKTSLGNSTPADQPLRGLHLVAMENCGVNGQQPHLVAGQNWFIAENRIGFDRFSTDDAARSNVYGKEIQYKYEGLNPEAKYRLRLKYLSDNDKRSIRLTADGTVIDDKVRLPFSKLVTRIVDLPPETYSDAVVALKFTQVSGTNSDAIISAIEIWSSDKTPLAGFAPIKPKVFLRGSATRPTGDMSWWYREPGEHFWEGMPIGTGRLGAMVLGASSG